MIYPRIHGSEHLKERAEDNSNALYHISWALYYLNRHGEPVGLLSNAQEQLRQENRRIVRELESRE